MENYDICFEKLRKQFDKSIKNECEIFKGRMSHSELYATALIALWYADITYRKDIVNFETYAIHSIREALKAYVRKNRSKRCFFSLNKQIGQYDSTTEAITTIRAPLTDWDMHLMVSIFISHLKGMERKVACALLGKSTAIDIIAEHQLSKEELNHILIHLRNKWMMQYGMV